MARLIDTDRAGLRIGADDPETGLRVGELHRAERQRRAARRAFARLLDVPPPERVGEDHETKGATDAD